MSEDFDPYYQWLGISPKYQPPNHYRLLGVEHFESNANVIATAADQRMAHVRSFQTGPNGKLTQPLLNELSAARRCLLDQQKKAEYDGKLRAEAFARQKARQEQAASNDDGDDEPGSGGASDLLNDLKAASRLTALEAEKLRLTQFQLPAAYRALGQHLFAERHYRQELAAEFVALEALRDEQKLEDADETSGRGIAGKIKDRAIAEKRARTQQALERKLGEAGFRRFAAAAGPPALTAPFKN